MAGNFDRIQEMEKALNTCREAADQLQVSIDRMEEIRETMIQLFRYYGSESWYEDRESPLPQNVAAGVLSEDLVYDLITDVRDASFQMLELSADILKNRI